MQSRLLHGIRERKRERNYKKIHVLSIVSNQMSIKTRVTIS